MRRAGCRTAVEREVALAAVASSGLRPSQGFSIGCDLQPAVPVSGTSCAAPKEHSLEACSTWLMADMEEWRSIATNDENENRRTGRICQANETEWTRRSVVVNVCVESGATVHAGRESRRGSAYASDLIAYTDNSLRRLAHNRVDPLDAASAAACQ